MEGQGKKCAKHFRKAWFEIDLTLQSIENGCDAEVVLFAYELVACERVSELSRPYPKANRSAKFLLKRLIKLLCEVLPNTDCRPWQSPMYKAKHEYDAMRYQFFSCWSCHAMRKPQAYYGPWMIERAHICNKPRKEDRRAVVMICTICHKVSHGESIAGFKVPKLGVAEMLFLKREQDAEWLDLEFLQRCSIKKLPVKDPLPSLPQEIYDLREANKLTYCLGGCKC